MAKGSGFDVGAITVNEDGAVVLSDAELESIASQAVSGHTAGGNTTNAKVCTDTNNLGCTNSRRCDGSDNMACTNVIIC